MTKNPENPTQKPEEESPEQPQAYTSVSFLKMLLGEAFPFQGESIDEIVDEMKAKGAKPWNPSELEDQPEVSEKIDTSDDDQNSPLVDDSFQL